jgi:acylphosphatase
MERKIKNIQINIYGRVQGVGFRYSALHKAQETGIRGYVKNMYDGSVFIEAEGDDTDVENFLLWCHKGPPWARIEQVKTTPGAIKNHTSFYIKS